MKKLLFLCAFLIFSLFQSQKCNAQKFKDSDKEKKIYLKKEQVPAFPGCKGSNTKLKRCMKNKISKHIKDNFIKDVALNLGFTGELIIYVIFKIDKDGNIIGVKAKGPHPQLANEAVRVINLLPKFKPGLDQNGQPVIVPFSLPIVVRI